MYRHALATLVFTGIAISNAACAQTIKPIKASASDLAGAIFARGDAATRRSRMPLPGTARMP
ncbi:hypothetical protein LGM42_22080 [Burkholderia sp. AU39826]|uniref:hypothetical protein n=1 Tax=Burkholderia sp. AU39826 TaxID=2879634 RepID=UPI001CF2C1FB|nr:hypothetical protein [Burkholderia sp. AU39826]MCA7972569.1 hypothetical protein [Burkholderia sp. AU39826]